MNFKVTVLVCYTEITICGGVYFQRSDKINVDCFSFCPELCVQQDLALYTSLRSKLRQGFAAEKVVVTEFNNLACSKNDILASLTS
jgi:hypothetical protein